MRLYEGIVSDFNRDVLENKVADQISTSFLNYYRRNVGASEYRSWQQSLNFLRNSFEYSGLTQNRLIIEYELPYSTRRIDVLLFGRGHSENDGVVLMELKQWSNENVEDCPSEGNVVVNYGQFKREQAHPSLQVQGYHYDLKDFLTIFNEEPEVNLDSCAYCHNYSRKGNNAVLFFPKFEKETQEFPLFAREDVQALGIYLKERLSKSSGTEIFGRFVTSPIRPSKRLLEHTSAMINKQQIFNLIDDQIAAYNSIMHKAKKLAQTDGNRLSSSKAVLGLENR